MNPFLQISSRSMGMPLVPREAVFYPKGPVTSYIPNMRPPEGWSLILCNTGNIRHYLNRGGDPSKAIVHFLSYDTGVLEPMWKEHLFYKRCARLRSFGISRLVSPDFSTWANWPVTVQLFNVYRSATVSYNLAREGFKLLVNPSKPAPHLAHFAAQVWPPDLPGFLWDCNHINAPGLNTPRNRRMFWQITETIFSALRPKNTIVYGTMPRTAAQWQARFGQKPLFCFSRAAVLARQCRAIDARLKAGGKVDRRSASALAEESVREDLDLGDNLERALSEGGES